MCLSRRVRSFHLLVVMGLGLTCPRTVMACDPCDNNCVVNIFEMANVQGCIQTSCHDCPTCDADSDGDVDYYDLGVFYCSFRNELNCCTKPAFVCTGPGSPTLPPCLVTTQALCYSFGYEINIALDRCPDPDADGDGLPDIWESQGGGIDGDGDGDPDVVLYDPPFNARPDHKDIFVEVDSVAGRMMSTDAEAKLYLAFDDAPVLNPDGRNGITLHIMKGQDNLPNTPSGVWNDSNHNGVPVELFQLRNSYFTGDEDPTSKDAAVMARIAAMRKAFRYCIFAKQLASKHSGRAIEADFCVALGPDKSSLVGWSVAEAAVFMHELGHSLGLDHGGRDDINGKPNYVSVMNYMYSLPFWMYNLLPPPILVSRWSMDYSREELPTLLESALDEHAGILSRQYETFTMGFGASYPAGGPRRRKVVRLDGTVTDWDGDGSITLAATVQGDLNWIPGLEPYLEDLGAPSYSPPQELTGHNDWAKLEYAVIRDLLPITAGVPDEAGGALKNPVEPTVEALVWGMDNLLPVCPEVIHEPCDGLILEGRSAHFDVLDAGSLPVTFQWRKDKVDLQEGGRFSGVTTPHLTIESVTADDIGQYDVVLLNACGSAVSATATLTADVTVLADCDDSGDVDALDFRGLFDGLYGPTIGQPLPCTCGDLDHDGDIDLFDFAVHQRAFGPRK